MSCSFTTLKRMGELEGFARTTEVSQVLSSAASWIPLKPSFSLDNSVGPSNSTLVRRGPSGSSHTRGGTGGGSYGGAVLTSGSSSSWELFSLPHSVEAFDSHRGFPVGGLVCWPRRP